MRIYNLYNNKGLKGNSTSFNHQLTSYKEYYSSVENDCIMKFYKLMAWRLKDVHGHLPVRKGQTKYAIGCIMEMKDLVFLKTEAYLGQKDF